MKQVLAIAFGVLSLLFAGSYAFGSVNPPRKSIESLVRMPKQSPRLARVRLAVELTNYKKFLVRNNYAKVSEMFRPLKPIKRHLRARIEKTNHFYIGDWHIETIPVKWSKEKMHLTMKLRFFRRYGTSNNLEESVGSTIISGHIEGHDYIYNFQGAKKLKFKNLMGHPLVDVNIGSPKAQPITVSDKKEKPGKSESL